MEDWGSGAMGLGIRNFLGWQYGGFRILSLGYKDPGLGLWGL